MKADFDVIVLGGGSGGYAAARTLVAGGLSTAVVESGPEVGGLCILRGCMPTKALLHASDVLHLARKAGIWGLKIPEAGFDFSKVMSRKASMVEEFARFRREQLEGGKFQFIRDKARFVGPHTLALEGGKELSARYFVVSTGSVVAPPPFECLRNIHYLTSDTALELKQLPASMIVLGGGAVAVEFAQFFARLDVKVTIIQRSAHLLRDIDLDAAAELEKVLRREGMEIYTGARLLEASETPERKTLVFECQGAQFEADAEQVLFALGRAPATRGLGLEAAGVQTENGRIATNLRMQTNVPHIFAAGDCTGPHEIVHIAIQQGETAAGNILHGAAGPEMDYRLLTLVVFTDPQVAILGLTEKEASRRGIPYLAASYPFNDHGKSIIMDALDGFVKLVCDPSSGEILGASCVGPAGGELIHEIIAAMYKRMTVQELAVMPHYHPTLAEIWTYPAEELAAQVGR